MAARKYETEQIEKGEWFEIVLKGFRLACCDCGLVHKLDFRMRKSGRLEVRMVRDERATGQIRRHMKPTKPHADR